MPKASVSRTVASWVFPISCLACGRESDWLCADCRRGVVVSQPERCAICGKAGFDGICDRCRLATKLDGVVAMFSYQQTPFGGLVKQIKYLGLHDGLTWFANAYRRLIMRRLPNEELLATFVPLDPVRLSQRGFNQSELLARAIIGDELPIAGLLTKTRPTAPQASLDQKSRQTNLRGAFKVNRPTVPEAVVVFDDVITTGATLGACAKALKRSGARTVWAVTVAHD